MNLEKIDPVVKICENLPLNITILEKKGCCQKPNADCKYNRLSLDPDIHFCYKKTITPDCLLTRILI